MDTLEWGRDDDFEFDDLDGNSYDHHMYSDPTYSNSVYDDFASSFQPAIFSFEPIPIKEEHYFPSVDSNKNFFNPPQQTQLKQEPVYQAPNFYNGFTFQSQMPLMANQIPAPAEPMIAPKKETQAVKTNSHKRQHCEVSSETSTDEVDIIVENQPPVEVRTRTPSEIRTFSVSAKVVGKWRQKDASIMKVSLSYATNSESAAESVKKEILGGTKTVALLPDGSAIFDNLWVSESSTKHKEREFCIEFTLVRSDGHELMKKYSKPFYAYSHKKVLQRRGNVKLRTLSKAYGRITGGEQMHVIGTPFIQGPALSLIFRTPHGDVVVKSLEYYSDSVLFFELPPYPLPEGAMVSSDTEIKVTVSLTNDGRTYSNPLEFSYIAV